LLEHPPEGRKRAGEGVGRWGGGGKNTKLFYAFRREKKKKDVRYGWGGRGGRGRKHRTMDFLTALGKKKKKGGRGAKGKDPSPIGTKKRRRRRCHFS